MDRPRHNPESSSHPHHPTLFASLHRRPRTAEIAAAAENSKEARERSCREAKRYLLQIVRNDWSFDPTAATSGVSSSSSTSSEAISPSQAPKERDVLEWRLREEDSSTSDLEAEQNAGNSNGDPYRFECPDAVQDAMLERRRKRRKLIEDEMEWNNGLRLWIQRRNAWTGARIFSPKKTDAETIPEQRTSSDEDTGDSTHANEEPEFAKPISFRPRSTELVSSAITDATSTQLPPAQSMPNSIIPEGSGVVSQPNLPRDIGEPLIPIPPPILPNSNPFRAYTTPTNYPAIYNKLVVEGNTPAVPVNLVHMTRALVQGWKREGQWPPKPTISKDIPVTRRRRAQPRTQLQLQAESSSQPKPPAASAAPTSPTTTTTTPTATSRRRSISSNVTGAVKKVLGFATAHPGHRFQIRGHTQNTGSSPTGEGPTEGSQSGNLKGL